MDTGMLVDDELVALALERGSHWPGPLPTVDAADPGELARAALRGRRSLLVRGGVTQAGLSEPLLALQATAVGATRLITLFRSNEVCEPTTWSLGVVAIPGDDGWYVDDLDEDGVHRFSVLDPADVARRFMDLLAGVAAQGLAAVVPGTTDRLCLAAASAPGSAEVLLVGRGTVSRGRLSEDAELLGPLKQAMPTDVAAAVQELVALVGRPA